MNAITVTQLPAQTVAVTEVEMETVYVSKGGVYRIIQPAIGIVDGINTIFGSMLPFEPASIEVFINGLKEQHFRLLSDMTLELEDPPKISGFVDKIELIYLSK